MRNFKEEWSQKLWYEKVVFAIGMVCSVSVIVLALLHLVDLWEDAISVYMPLMAIVMLAQAFENRKRSRSVMWLSLGTAAFISIVWIMILFVL